MNIIAHGLWGVALTPKKQLRQIKWSVFWSIFPDLIWGSLTLPYWIFNKFRFPGDWDASPWWFYHLYGFGHSVIIWGSTFIFVSVLSKKWRWLLLFWLFHILVDIPGHTLFQTPFLYPLSTNTFSGLFTWSDYSISTVSHLIPLVIIFLKFSLRLKK